MKVQQSTQDERLDLLISDFKAESAEYRDLHVPGDREGKRRILRSLMNVRMPRKTAERTLRIQDEYLTDVLGAIWDNPEIVGYAIWQMKDNRTYHRNSNLQPAKQMAGHSIAGLFDAQGRPKKSVETVKRFFNSARIAQ